MALSRSNIQHQNTTWDILKERVPTKPETECWYSNPRFRDQSITSTDILPTRRSLEQSTRQNCINMNSVWIVTQSESQEICLRNMGYKIHQCLKVLCLSSEHFILTQHMGKMEIWQKISCNLESIKKLRISQKSISICTYSMGGLDLDEDRLATPGPTNLTSYIG